MQLVRKMVLCGGLVMPAACYGQSADQALKDFRADVFKEHLVLQGFSADPVTKFQWTDAGLVLTPPKTRALGLFYPEAVKLHKNQITIEGQLHILIKTKDGTPALPTGIPSTIKIDLQSADAATVLPQLKLLLFFPTLAIAISAMPPGYAMVLPAELDVIPAKSLPEKPKPSWAEMKCLATGGKFTPPEYIKTTSHPDVFFPEHDRGTVRIAFTIDESGHAVDPWLAIPADLPFLKSDLDALYGEVFKPAACNGSPVKTTAQFENTFKIH